MARGDEDRYTEAELSYLIGQIIQEGLGGRLIDPSELVQPGDPYVDLAFEKDGILTLVEVKSVVPQTAARIDELLRQLLKMREAVVAGFPGRSLRLALAVPGVLTLGKARAIVGTGFEIWDRRWILGHAEAVGLAHEAYRMVGPEYEEPRRLSQADQLRSRLQEVACGRPEWFQYQKLCGDILEYLFSPPLEAPIRESSNVARVNRRDYVIPNYATEGFWAFLRDHYRADYVVVDAKNYCGDSTKSHVLQLANYLSHHGTGLFGVIVTRNGMDAAATYTCREQWVLHNKMIVLLNDDDLVQMLETKASGDDPGILVRQKIEDFRLGM